MSNVFSLSLQYLYEIIWNIEFFNDVPECYYVKVTKEMAYFGFEIFISLTCKAYIIMWVKLLRVATRIGTFWTIEISSLAQMYLWATAFVWAINNIL